MTDTKLGLSILDLVGKGLLSKLSILSTELNMRSRRSLSGPMN